MDAAYFQEAFLPLLTDVVHVPFDDLASVEAAFAQAPETFAAFIVEPIQGRAAS